MISWLTTALSDYFELESVQGNINVMPAILQSIHPTNVCESRLTPNIVTRTMFLLGLIFLVLVLVAFPFSLLVYPAIR